MPTTSSTITRTAWLVVVLLMPVALLNYLDRQMLASMKYSVMADITSIESDKNWGLMLGQFKWVYAACSLVGGYVADRFSRRYVICTSLLVWSAITWATGHATTFDQLLWTRSLMGISEAFYMPAALALITDYHIGHTRSRAVGLHQTAQYFGVILGGFGGFVADSPQLGWRFAFTVCGAFGILYSLPLSFFLRDASRPNDIIAEDAAYSRTNIPQPVQAVLLFLFVLASLSTGVCWWLGQITLWRSTCLIGVFIAAFIASNRFWELWTNPSFLLLVAYFTLPGFAGWVVRDWMPAILKDEFKISQGHAGVAATLFWQTAAIFGAVFGGWLADRWMRKSTKGRIYASAVGMSLMVPAMFGMGFSQSLMLAIASLSLFGLGWGFFDCNNMPILSQIVRPHLRATGYGIMNFVSIGCGGLADWGFGILRDNKIPLSQIFGAFASVAIVSIFVVLLIRPRQEFTDRDQPHA